MNYLSSKCAGSWYSSDKLLKSVDFLFKLSNIHIDQHLYQKAEAFSVEVENYFFKTCCYRVIFKSETIKFAYSSACFLNVTCLCRPVGSFYPIWFDLIYCPNPIDCTSPKVGCFLT